MIYDPDLLAAQSDLMCVNIILHSIEMETKKQMTKKTVWKTTPERETQLNFLLLPSQASNISVMK